MICCIPRKGGNAVPIHAAALCMSMACYTTYWHVFSCLWKVHCLHRQVFPVADFLKETRLIPRAYLEIVIVIANFYAKVWPWLMCMCLLLASS